MKKEELLEKLTKQQETINAAIDYIQNRSINKLDMLLHLQELNKNPENSKFVASFRKFFEEDEEHER